MDTQVQKLSISDVQKLLPERSQEEWDAIRENYLARGFCECSVPGCTRLVSPAFVRDIEGLGRVAICPNPQRHGRLGPTRLQALMRAYAQAQPVAQQDQAAESDATPADEPVAIDTKRRKAPVEA